MSEEEPKFLTEKEVSALIKKKLRNVSGRTRLSMAQQVFQRQADATLTQANPTANTWYAILATAKNVRVYSIVVEDTWTVQPDPLEVAITIDGQTITFAVANPASGTLYVATRKPTLVSTAQVLTAQADADDLTAPAFLCEGRSVLIQAKIGRTTPGTSNPLEGRVKYAKIP